MPQKHTSSGCRNRGRSNSFAQTLPLRELQDFDGTVSTLLVHEPTHFIHLPFIVTFYDVTTRLSQLRHQTLRRVFRLKGEVSDCESGFSD